ncbi:hypothetical protein SASPL_117430 [Salvia splendens]|uniref:Malate synthase n=1 Tax=Salvia splendens TaxID=180675 RepID=A0A8X8Y0J1_SALSN|nr:hypothetical protein SASPL_117430 [Salvia splendens]
MGYDVPEGVEIRGRYDEEFGGILSKDAVQFVADLQREFKKDIEYAMDCRKEAQTRYNNNGELPGFDPATKLIRDGDWRQGQSLQAEPTHCDTLCPPHRLASAIDGHPATACLVDFGLYFFHNHSLFRQTQGKGFGPFFYLPKMENSREAKIWNRVFEKAEKVAGIDNGSIIETLPAVFQMDEILHELKDHSAGLNCGRWDYIFSYIKTFQAHPDRLLPDRAAQIPIKDDPGANEAAMELVRKDKLREVEAGHDGTWAAHPGLIPTIMEVFNGRMGDKANQIQDEADAAEADLLQLRTHRGGRTPQHKGWDPILGSVGQGSRISAAVWVWPDGGCCQWLKYGADLDGDGLGVKVTPSVVAEEMARIASEVGKDRFDSGRYEEACNLFTRQCLLAPKLKLLWLISLALPEERICVASSCYDCLQIYYNLPM